MSRTQLVLANRNVLAGLFFLLVAGVFAYAAMELQMGTTLRMGPGYFPMVLCGLLALFGVITLINGLREVAPETVVSPVAWSRMALVCGAALFFGLTLDGLGMPITVFGTVLISAYASRRFRLLEGVLLGIAVSVATWVIFPILLGMPFDMLGSWFG